MKTKPAMQPVSAALTKLLHGATKIDLNNLFEHFDSLYEKFHIVSDFTALLPCPSIVPWPVALVLATSSKKFVLRSEALPNLSKVSQDTNMLARKIKWGHFYKNTLSISLNMFKRHSPPPLLANKGLLS